MGRVEQVGKLRQKVWNRLVNKSKLKMQNLKLLLAGKKWLFIGSAGVLLLIIALFAVFRQKQTTNLVPGGTLPTTIPSGGIPIPTHPAENIITKKITISGVDTNNFLKMGKEANKEGDWLIVDATSYQIVYFNLNGTFLISILSSPFDKIRSDAEARFIKELGITKEQACNLTVNITTPSFANPSEAGKTRNLSFCQNQD